MAKNEAKIKFTAETGEFNASIKRANDEMSELRAELKLNAAQMENTGNTAEGLKKKHSLLEAQLKASQSKTEALNAKVEKAAEIYGENSTEVTKLKTQLANAQTAEEKIKREIDACNKELDEQGKEFEDTGKSAGNFGEKLSNIGGAICKGAAAGLATVTAAAGAAGAALAKMTTDGAAYADDILTTSTQTGIATDKLQEYQYAAELVDVSTDTLTKSMAKQIKSMKAVQDGTKLSVEAYDKLGVEVMNSDGTLRDSQTVYWEVIDALGKVENETERDALAMQILGKSAQELNPLIEAGSEKMNELGKQAHEAGYVLGDETLNAYGALDDQLQYLSVGAEGAKNALGAVLLPVLTDLAGSGTELLNEFTSGVADANGDIGKIGDVIGAVLPKAVDKVMEFVPQILDLGLSIIGSLGSALIGSLPSLLDGLVTTVLPKVISGLVSVFDAVVSALPSLVKMIASALPTLIPLLIDGLVSMIVILCTNFSAIIQPIIDNLPNIIISVVNALMSNLPSLIDGLITLTLGIVSAIPQIIQNLVDVLPQVISMIVTGLLNCLPDLIKGGIQLVVGIVKALPQILSSLKQALPAAFKGIWNGIKNVFAPVGSWFGEKFKGAKESATNAWADAKSKFSATWSNIKGAFSNVGGWFKDQFNQGKENAKTAWSNAKTVFSGIWNGIKNVFSNVGGWFKDKFNSAKEGAVNTWSNIKSKFSSIKDGIVKAFSNIKEKLTAPFTKARDAIKGVADKIKGFFKGEISMPKIKTPHFGISPKGWKIGDLLEGSIPKLSIDWYADGGIMTKPTIFGMNGSRLMAGGEAGYEAILPIDRLQDYVSNAVERSMQALNLNALANAVEDLANRPVDVYVNGRKFAQATVGDSDRVQGMRNRITDRGVLLD